MRKILLFTLFFYAGSLCSSFADPWGKDSDICYTPRSTVWKGKSGGECKRCITPVLGVIAEVGISFHQNVISPADGPRSHFIPSSSQYTLDAMRKYGFFQGFVMGCDRLMRENNDPWIYRTTIDAAGKKMKLNPVP